jgi:hypothetical protein
MLSATLKSALLLRHALARAGQAGADDVHIGAAASWLIAAQQAAGGGGFAHSFHLLNGWQPPYPETTGYIIPTLHRLYRRNGDPALQASLVAAVAWLKSIQQQNGSFTDLHGRQQVFDTGQILIGLNYLAEHAPEFDQADMLARAAHWLASVQEANGDFIKDSGGQVGYSYCARVGAALTVAGRLLNEDRLRRAGEANLCWTLAQQEANGFFRHLSLDQSPPFLHTMIYAMEGLLDGYAEIRNPSLLAAAMRFAEPLLTIAQRRDRILRSQYHEDFAVANGEKCLVGLAQWAGLCLRLADLKGLDSYRDEALKTIDFLKRRQIRCGDYRLDGGLWGSDPFWGRYMRFSIPNWGVKFFMDALLLSDAESNQRPERIRQHG